MVSDNKTFVDFFKNNDIKMDNETTLKTQNDNNFGQEQMMKILILLKIIAKQKWKNC